MAIHEDREAFIPYRRTDLIELCIEDGGLSPEKGQLFREFCEILSAYYHFHFHQSLEVLKDNFDPFNPDADTKVRASTPAEKTQMGETLSAAFETILERANYVPLSQESLEQAFEEESLIQLKTEVDFDDFEQMLCYYRGDTKKTISVKKYFIKTVEQDIETFERVVLLLKFKEEDYFIQKDKKIEELNFTPGKMYVYLYKNIPKFDLELLFPNIELSMTLRDRLLFVVPAIGGAISLLIKALPQLIIIVGVILFLSVGPSALENINANEEDVRDIMPVMVTLLSLLVALGGFGFKQYTGYKNKRIQFLKKVTDTLFFRNLDSNAGVFHALIDAAEEEECKEIILVYYHLLTNNGCLTPEQLDDHIETWMEQTFGTKIDFDINGPLGNLQSIRGQLKKASQLPIKMPLLSYDKEGCCRVLPLHEAKQVIDDIWDNAFVYANEALTPPTPLDWRSPPASQ